VRIVYLPDVVFNCRVPGVINNLLEAGHELRDFTALGLVAAIVTREPVLVPVDVEILR
jgi:hypothetical protein